MVNEINVTITGNLGKDPEYRTSNSGTPMVTFSVGSTPRTRDRDGNWSDGDTMWINCRAFYNLAENINASLTKGDRVVIQGKMTQRNYQDQAGNNRFSIDMLVEELGASLRSATVKVTKNQRGDFQGGYNQTGGFKGASNSSFGFQSAETPGGFGAGDSLSGSSQSQFDAVPPPF